MNNYLPRILVTGGDGQLASALRYHHRASECYMIFSSRLEVDITDLESAENAIKRLSPDVIINTAAYTKVDKAEEERELSSKVNGLGVKNLAMLCEKYKLRLIQISSDYVFDGAGGQAYHEDDITCPVNFYGQTKIMGEEAARQYCEQSIILRVSSVFSQYGNNFLKTICRLANEKKELCVVADQIMCPTYAGDIADVIFSVIQKKTVRGTYHYCGDRPVSWYEFALAILAKKRKNIKAVTTDEYVTLAKRPAYSVLSCHKIKNELRIVQASWENALCDLV